MTVGWNVDTAADGWAAGIFKPSGGANNPQELFSYVVKMPRRYRDASSCLNKSLFLTVLWGKKHGFCADPRSHDSSLWITLSRDLGGDVEVIYRSYTSVGFLASWLRFAPLPVTERSKQRASWNFICD